MRLSVKIAAVTIVAGLVLACAIFVAVVPTYTVSASVNSAFVIWNDDVSVVFVPRRNVGSARTSLEQLASLVARWAGMRAFSPRQCLTTDGVILRFENGAVRTSREKKKRRAPWSASVPRPRFIDGRLLLFGGVWNGREIDTIEPNEYLRLMSSPQPDDPGTWHSQFLLEGSASADLPLRIRGEAFTLKSSTIGAGVTIDLVRDGASVLRRPRGCSSCDREPRPSARASTESMFGDAPSVVYPFSP